MVRHEGKEDESYHADGTPVCHDHAAAEVEHVFGTALPDLQAIIRNCSIERAAQHRVEQEQDEEFVVVRADAVVDEEAVLPQDVAMSVDGQLYVSFS